MDDYQWYMQNPLKEYSGQWVAIKNQAVIASNKDLKLLFEELDQLKISISEIFLASIPRSDIPLIYSKLC